MSKLYIAELQKQASTLRESLYKAISDRRGHADYLAAREALEATNNQLEYEVQLERRGHADFI